MARPSKNNPEGKQKSPKLTPEAIKKLEEAFAIDASIDEACFYCGITPPTYYEWIKRNPKLSERFSALRNKPVLLARQTAVSKLGESYATAMDYLSRKRKNEFSQKTETENSNSIQLDVSINKAIEKAYSETDREDAPNSKE